MEEEGCCKIKPTEMTVVQVRLWSVAVDHLRMPFFQGKKYVSYQHGKEDGEEEEKKRKTVL